MGFANYGASEQTRKKLKEAYDAEFAAVIERAEKQIILAKHGQRLLALLDDSPITPGDTRRVYEQGGAARQILNDAEDDLKSWEANWGQDLVRNEATGFGTGTSGGVPRGGEGEVSAKSHATGTSTDETANAGNEEFATASSSPTRHEE